MNIPFSFCLLGSINSGTYVVTGNVTIVSSLQISNSTFTIGNDLILQSTTSLILQDTTLVIEGNFTSDGTIEIIPDQSLKTISIKGCANLKGNLIVDLQNLSSTLTQGSSFSILDFNCSVGQFNSIEILSKYCFTTTYTKSALIVTLLGTECSGEDQGPNLPLVIGLSVGIPLLAIIIAAILFGVKPLRERIMPYHKRQKIRPQSSNTQSMSSVRHYSAEHASD